MNWTPTTLEDRLLARYHAEHPGTLFVELPVGGADETHGPRRLDGLLLPADESVVYAQGAYSQEEARIAIQGRAVHLLEAKRTLNRNVIGQVVVGAVLLRDQYQPSAIENVAVCGSGNRDLQLVCDELGIGVAIYPETQRRRGQESRIKDEKGRVDLRRPPDPARRKAFMTGWSEAVDGTLYGTILSKKTHAGMGNLFGWIYGNQSEGFQEATWERYIATLPSSTDKL